MFVNRFGGRGKEWASEEVNSQSNILFVGDSFVFGYGVDDELTITTQIETLFRENKNMDIECIQPYEFIHQGNSIAAKEIFNYLIN